MLSNFKKFRLIHQLYQNKYKSSYNYCLKLIKSGNNLSNQQKISLTLDNVMAWYNYKMYYFMDNFCAKNARSLINIEEFDSILNNYGVPIIINKFYGTEYLINELESLLKK